MRSPEVDRLFRAILSLKNEEECYRFFEDLCTVGEIRALAQRFRVAEMLYNGMTYEAIAERTGMSSATISRIKRFLEYGSDGYRLAIERLRSQEGMKTGKERVHPPRNSTDYPEAGS